MSHSHDCRRKAPIFTKSTRLQTTLTAKPWLLVLDLNRLRRISSVTLRNSLAHVRCRLLFFLHSALENLIAHALRALRDCMPSESELNTRNCSLCIVGQGTPFTIYEDEQVNDFYMAHVQYPPLSFTSLCSIQHTDLMTIG